ncbi:5'/3'-nucleotidase SurE [Olivibacter sitiensis]|uniref:5'/3'-nucleotidase SurE n=1 Tax=Olivibacter sitiensis TaxID=376470 RepID=UPI000417C811|nr:5'/3'-nucleotidase SurE [Olivibacter sitiensis]
MNILITNDDGIYAPGIAALARIAKEFGTVRIMAPDVEQSSMGHAITHSRPLYVKKSVISFNDIEALRVNGTPADCVALGTELWPDTDIVLSGINMGTNLGNAMWHSGTLSAARQAVMLGFRGIALSTPVGDEEPDFDYLAPYVLQCLELLMHDTEPALYNVNFPRKPKAIAFTRQSVRHYDGRVVTGEDPLGRKNYWISVRPIEEVEVGTDRYEVQQGNISITPLRLDLTDEEALQKMKKWDNIIFQS